MRRKEAVGELPETKTKEKFSISANWKAGLSWGITGLLVGALILLVLNVGLFSRKISIEEPTPNEVESQLILPTPASTSSVDTVFRMENINTTVPQNVRYYPLKYTVEPGDSIFTIAKKYDLSAETILWANYDLLGGDPTFLKEGWQLVIPPTNGVYYKWQNGDSLDKVAQKYQVKPEAIVTWPGNHLDVTNPVTDNLGYIMIPGGFREVVSWIKPVDFSPRSGVTKEVEGPGGCVPPATGPVGSGNFQWPVGNHYLSGFDFSSLHLGIDIAASLGTPVYAADSGTVVYAGWNDSGYGNLVAIDHNNGYKTLYAHLSSFVITCGSNVNAGQLIAYSGSTGKSTGGHLHFEVRYYSQFVNPWQVLP